MTGTPTAPDGADVEQVARTIAASRSAEEGPLMLVLHDIQRELGYIDPRCVQIVADELNLSRADVHGVITFYSDFRQTPPGQTSVRICRAEACQAVGGRALAAHAKDRLGVEFGATLADGSVTLDQVFCFGNCALGPAAQINGRLYGRVDPARFDSLLEEARR